MGLTNEEPDNSSSGTDETVNLWQSILNDVQKHGNPKLNPNKQIVVLGNNESGKTTMVGAQMPPNRAGLHSFFRWQSCKELTIPAKGPGWNTPTST